MRRASPGLLVAAAILLAPYAALAAEPAFEEPFDIFLKGLNLALVIGVIVWFGREPLRSFFADRRHTVSHDLGEAAKLLASAEQKFTEWERRTAGLDAELAEIREHARERAEADRRRILADAEASAERVRRDTQTAVEQEVRRAREELQSEAADLAMKLAAKMLSERITPADREKLVEDFVSKLEQAASGPQGRA